MTNIVTVNVTVQSAPIPGTLQQTGAFLSQGATVLTPGTSMLLTQPGDLTSIVRGSQPLSSLTWSAGVATATTISPHGLTNGDNVEITIVGATPASYNGSFLSTVISPNQVTYPMPLALTTATVPGTLSLEDIAELNAMVLTYFAQANTPAVYVLELGAGSVNEGVAALAAYLLVNPTSSYTPGVGGVFYSFLVPRTWDANANFLALIAQYESTTAKQYFFITTTLETYSAYNDLMKDVIRLVEAPPTAVYPTLSFNTASWSGGTVTAVTPLSHNVAVGDWFQVQGFVPAAYNGYYKAQLGTSGTTLIWNLASNPGTVTTEGSLIASQVEFEGLPSTEFSLAAAFAVSLSYRPAPTNKVTPFNNSFLFGVTPFPQTGNGAILQTLKSANVSIIDTGAEGGITNALLNGGYTGDGRDFTWWYSVDNFALLAKTNTANIVINGSNNPINPLYDDQSGIDRLQDGVVAAANTELSVGLALSNSSVVRTSLASQDFQIASNAGSFAGRIVVNAVPFVSYYSAKPGDFKIGEYDGLSVQYIPARGFSHILIDVVATDIIS